MSDSTVETGSGAPLHTLNTDTDLFIPKPPRCENRREFDWTQPHSSGYTVHEFAYRRMLSERPPTLDGMATEAGVSFSVINNWWRKSRPTKAKGQGNRPPKPTITGVKASVPRHNGAAVWAKLEAAQAEWEAEQALRKAQEIAFPAGTGAAGFAIMSDLHIGGDALYREMREDAERAVRHDMSVILLGDYLNNWVVGRLMGNQRSESVQHGAALAAFRWWLEMLGPHLVAVVGGNHDNWAEIAGMDYVRAAVAGINPECLYDANDVTFALRVGPARKVVVARHKWRGNSIYNATHGIERAARFGSVPFDIGMGGHLHSCTVARPFHILDDPNPKLAVQVSTYKRNDKFATQEGFPQSYGRGAGCIVVEEDGAVTGFADLERGAEFLEARREAWARR